MTFNNHDKGYTMDILSLELYQQRDTTAKGLPQFQAATKIWQLLKLVKRSITGEGNSYDLTSQ